MKLVYEASGKEVQVGDTVHLDGNAYTVWHFDKPHKPASSGKVFIRPISNENGFSAEYYVGVIGAKWIEREDREAQDEYEACARMSLAPSTKVFKGWGSQVLTRTEFQQYWLNHSGQMFPLFRDAPSEFLELQTKVEQLAGVVWDKHK